MNCGWGTCSQTFEKPEQLIPHISKSHLGANIIKPTLDLELKCKWSHCEDKEPSLNDLLTHVTAEHVQATIKCQWEQCGSSFETMDTLTHHLSEEHVGYRKQEYICRWMGCSRDLKPMLQRQKMIRHLQTHTGNKPYECMICTMRFADMNSMQTHHLLHEGVKPFKCQTCDKAFAVQSALNVHQRTHTGEKPFGCTFDGCEKRFQDSSNLTKHQRTHTGP
ncbi:hypothetical protein EDD86DRAFT_262497 [Gorgonomyces haynaldii]|nr:hypothetical protein EDD86DRAFT_262497 [Gorgonomyces haynaldii]